MFCKNVPVQDKVLSGEKSEKMVCVGGVRLQRTPFFRAYLSQVEQLCKSTLMICVVLVISFSHTFPAAASPVVLEQDDLSTPSPETRQPLLVVCSFAAEPDRVQPTQEFVLTVQVCNAGNQSIENGALTFGGGSFITVGEKSHFLGQILPGGAATVWQRLRAPENTSAGLQMVDMVAHASDPSGKAHMFQESIGVEVTAPPAASEDESQSTLPRLVVFDSYTTPASLHPGDAFELSLTLRNLGAGPALDLQAALAPNGIVTPGAGGQPIFIERIAADGVVTLSAPLSVHPQAETGYQLLTLNLEYSDASHQVYSSSREIGLDISTDLARQPKLIISAFQSEPEFVSPGDSFSLTLELRNVGDGEARQVSLILGGDNLESLKPFAPVGAGNVHYLPRLGAGHSASFTMELMVDGKAEARAYNLPVKLAYGDEGDQSHTEEQVVSLLVHNRPMFRAGFYKDVPGGTVGQQMRLPLEFANLSANRFNITTIEVIAEEMVISNSSAFVGRLDGGGIFSLEATGIPQQAGQLEITVIASYLDDFNQQKTWSQTLTVESRERPAAPQPPEQPADRQPAEGSLWQVVVRFVMGIFGLGS
jgi:hypothetical protein